MFNYLYAMKYGHTKLIVCPHVWHKWDTNARWTPVRHVSDMRSYMSHLKNIIFRLGCASNMTGYSSDTRWTRLRRMSDITEHGSDMARVRPSIFFPIIWWTKKKFKGPKTQIYLGILFEVSIKIVPHIFWKEYRKYTWYIYILRILHFLEGFRK